MQTLSRCSSSYVFVQRLPCVEHVERACKCHHSQQCDINISSLAKPSLHIYRQPAAMIFGFLFEKTPNEENTRRGEREALTGPKQKRDFDGSEMTETKRTKVNKPTIDARDSSSTKERSSTDSRRKDGTRGKVKSSPRTQISSVLREIGHFNHVSSGNSASEQSPTLHERLEQPLMQSQRHNIHQHQFGETNGAKASQRSTTDIRETASVKERTPTEKRKKAGRSRSYSASVQDIPSMKSRSGTAFDERIKEHAVAEVVKDHKRGRANSVMPRDVAPVDQNRIVDDRSVERTRKRRDTSTVRDPIIQDLIVHNKELKKELELTQDYLKNAEQKKLELHRTNNTLRDEKAQLLERESMIRADANGKERDAQQKIAEYIARHRKQEEEIRNLKEKLRYVEEKNSQTTNLLQVRTADLKSAEVFLTTADQYSGSDIINMVNVLNAEIFQVAAYIAELLEDPSTVATEDDRKKNLQKYTPSVEGARKEIGDILFAYFLDKGSHVRVDPLPVQLAIQSLLSRWCAIMVNHFCHTNTHSDLTRLYQEIQNSGMLSRSKFESNIYHPLAEVQAVSGRWRAITYSHIKALDNQTFSDEVLNMAIGLLCLCGWSLYSPRSQKVILAMQQMVKALEKLWQQLRSATKEGVTTADIDVFFIDFNRPYDDAEMEDMYVDTSSKSTTQIAPEMHVLCTVGLGLKRTVMKRVAGRTPEKREDILIKPKVALKTILRDIASITDNTKGKQVSG